jgi:hypothetical protein
MKLKQLSLFFCILLISLAAEAQVTLNGVTLPAKIKQDNNELVLNGGGIRKKLFFKLYTAGLYLPVKNKNASEIVTADKPTAIRLVITSTVINSGNMSEAIQEGFGKSLKGNTAPFQSKIDAFIDIFKKEEIKEGDVFEIWYTTAEGVRGYKNGKLKGTIAGFDFKKALFGIWLSDTPVDEDLKKALLGG